MQPPLCVVHRETGVTTGDLRPEDAGRMVALLNNVAVVRYLSQRIASPYTHADADAFVARVVAGTWPSETQPGRFWALRNADDRFCGAMSVEPGSGEFRENGKVGYYLAPELHGRGIMGSMVRGLADWALAQGTLRRLEAGVHAPNRASARVLLAAGFHLESTARAAVLGRDGNRCDHHLFVRDVAPPEENLGRLASGHGDLCLRRGFVTPRVYQTLREQAGWGTLPDAARLETLGPSVAAAAVYVDDTPTACARMIGDGLYFYLQDVLVAPAFQRRGLGTRLVHTLLADSAPMRPPGSTVALLAASGAEAFWSRMGFVRRGSDRPGMVLRTD